MAPRFRTKFHQEIWRRGRRLLENFRDSCFLFFDPIKKTVSGFPGSGGRGSEGGLDGRRTWRRSSWTGRRSCRAGLGSSCPSGWSRGGRSCLPSPCQLRNRRNDRLFLVGRSLRCRNVSSLTSSTVFDSSSGCFLFSRRSASTHCGVCGRARMHCRPVPRLCFSSKESLLLSHNSCKMCPLSWLKTGKKEFSVNNVFFNVQRWLFHFCKCNIFAHNGGFALAPVENCKEWLWCDADKIGSWWDGDREREDKAWETFGSD